jgi:hypothetical protein
MTGSKRIGHDYTKDTTQTDEGYYTLCWGGYMDTNSSYTTELTAIVKMLMIIPLSWDITWVTDSESAMNKLQKIESEDVDDRMTEWQLLMYAQEIMKKRTGKFKKVHQKSHKGLQTMYSVGNAAADLMAEHFTTMRERGEPTEKIDKKLTDRPLNVLYNGTTLTSDIRKLFRKDNGREAEKMEEKLQIKREHCRDCEHRSIHTETKENTQEQKQRAPDKNTYNGTHKKGLGVVEEGKRHLRILQSYKEQTDPAISRTRGEVQE